MGINNFGINTPSKSLDGADRYDGNSGNVNRCKNCQHSTVFNFKFQDKKIKSILEKIHLDTEVYCIRKKCIKQKWDDCSLHLKIRKETKGWLKGCKSEGWYFVDRTFESFKDIVEENSIVKSVNAYDVNNNLCFENDIVRNENGYGVFIIDINRNEYLIPLEYYNPNLKISQMNLEIPAFKFGRAGFEICGSIYELTIIQGKTIEEFLGKRKEIKLTKEGNLPKKRGRKLKEEIKEEPLIPIKRGRGRPRKNPID